MGISYEKWAHCDNCGESKSYPGDNTDDPPWGFTWVTQHETGRSSWRDLFCWDCADAREGL